MMRHVVFIGPQGAGKGTQADAVAPRLKLVHLATGDLFRSLMARDTPLADEVRSYYDAGNLVPDDLTARVLFAALDEAVSAQSIGALFDGFPRNETQASVLDQQIEDRGEELAAVIHIAVPRDILIERLAGRLICRSCGRAYHRTFQPPTEPGICDFCGGALYQRSDDTEEAVARRLQIYYAQTEPLLERWRKRDLVEDIDGAGAVSAVTDAIVAALGPRLQPATGEQ